MVNLIQDSGFQSQIDNLKKQFYPLSARFSVPIEPISDNKAKRLDLSPIKQPKKQENLQETDDDLQQKLNDIFTLNNEEQELDDQNNEEEQSHDVEMIYNQEVKLPMLSQQDHFKA